MLTFDRYEVMTFDCYGTLIDWESGILSAIRPILSARHIDLPDNSTLELYAELESQAEEGEFCNYKSVLRSVIEGFGRRLNFKPDEYDLNCLQNSLGSWLPFPDTVEALQVLKTKYKLAVISNIDDDLFYLSAHHLQVPFDWIITSEQLRSYKPSLYNFRAAVRIIGLPAEKILHVAQSIYHDIVPAKQLHLSAAWVNRRHKQEGAGATPLAHSEPDLEVPDLATFVNLLSR